ncbi:MAG: metallophosphoesterase [Bacteroidales bacterium]|nr:metallophosphoesterase [Bacteroidales bacterium]
MKSRDIAVFLTIVFLIYAGANTFLYFKGAVAYKGILSTGLYNILFIVISLSFIAGKILERRYSSLLADILNITGGFWLSFIFYSIIILVATDLLRLSFMLTGVLPDQDIRAFRQYSYLVSSGLASLLVAGGFLNTLFPAIRKYEIVIDKPAEVKELRIAAVSDIHLGSIIGKRSMRMLSKKLDAISPDMVLFLGDTVDGEINPVLRNDLLEALRLPDSARHVYAISGNHEYIGNYSKTIPYIEEKGLRVLADETVFLEEGILLLGRKDRDSFRYTGEGRKELSDLMDGQDLNKPVIVMDHQPPMKKDSEISGFDLMLSGHTHKGQMWPLNHLTSRIYKITYGHRLIGGCHYIVSSGFGSWGPRVRIGNRPEVLDIRLIFNS